MSTIRRGSDKDRTDARVVLVCDDGVITFEESPTGVVAVMEVPKGLGVGGGCGVTDVVNTVAIAAVQAGPSGESA